jgi:hypothetical protein
MRRQRSWRIGRFGQFEYCPIPCADGCGVQFDNVFFARVGALIQVNPACAMLG